MINATSNLMVLIKAKTTDYWLQATIPNYQTHVTSTTSYILIS